MDILQQIVDHKRHVELPARKSRCPEGAIRARALEAPAPRDFLAALRSRTRPALIAEVKRSSPSRGPLHLELDPAGLARTYERHGAAALSVLTDERFFGGTMADLTAVRSAIDLPVLRKDFVIDPYQILEARAAGADAVLLIARVLSEADLAALLACAAETGLSALVEVHDLAEIQRVAPLKPVLIGINSRNLSDLTVSLDGCIQLRAAAPAGACCVAESGIRTAEDVRRVAAAGFDAMLVGEALVTAGDVGERVKELTHAC